jgi:hypothetical protein
VYEVFRNQNDNEEKIMNNNQKIAISMTGGIAAGAAAGAVLGSAVPGVGTAAGVTLGVAYGAGGGAVAAGMWANSTSTPLPKAPMTAKEVNDAVFKGYSNSMK